MFVVGLDIGYSNLKVAVGDSEQREPEFHTLPVGAGPEEYLPIDVFGTHKKGEGIVVNVDGETFVAGVEPWEFAVNGWIRELHADYSSTKTYKALFHAALLLASQRNDQNEIDLLVTGLPVSQYFDVAFRQKLQTRLTGVHQVTPQIEIKVKDVRVIGQPLGAFMDALVNESEDFVEDVSSGTVLVFDVGFFSVDWVLLQNKKLSQNSSGSSIYATSELIKKASDLISKEYGRAPKLDDMESAIRQNKDYVLVFSKRVKIQPFMEQAARTVSDTVLREIRQSIKSQKVDMVILTGGGAKYYEKMLKEHLPGSKIYRSHDSVRANARGFWHYGTTLV